MYVLLRSRVSKIVLRKKSPTHLSSTFKNQGLDIPIEHAPHLKELCFCTKHQHRHLRRKIHQMPMP